MNKFPLIVNWVFKVSAIAIGLAGFIPVAILLSRKGQQFSQSELTYGEVNLIKAMIAAVLGLGLGYIVFRVANHPAQKPSPFWYWRRRCRF